MALGNRIGHEGDVHGLGRMHSLYITSDLNSAREAVCFIALVYNHRPYIKRFNVIHPAEIPLSYQTGLRLLIIEWFSSRRLMIGKCTSD